MLERAVRLVPKSSQTRTNVASCLQTVGRYGEAVREYEQALALDASSVIYWHGLAFSKLQMDDLDGAIEACRTGLKRDAGNPEIIVVLANALEAAGRIEEAGAMTETVLASGIRHDRLREKYLHLQNFLDVAAAEVSAAHHRFAMRGDAVPVCAPVDPDPERCIRVGILSGDLRTHSVGHFAKAIVAAPRDRIRIVVFSSSPAAPTAPSAKLRPPDPLQEWYRARADEWVESHALGDAALADAIRSRGIDVVLELSGHLALGRLPALERTPAPVVVTGIGYPNTTGSAAVDWRIVDSITDPAGSESLCRERLL